MPFQEAKTSGSLVKVTSQTTLINDSGLYKKLSLLLGLYCHVGKVSQHYTSIRVRVLCVYIMCVAINTSATVYPMCIYYTYIYILGLH